MTHYFTNDPNLKSDEKKITTYIGNQEFTFFTDRGVFSKKGLDFGTRCLLETIDLTSIKGKVLDFGCGYGPIGIYIKKNTDALVDMIDINHRSLHLASLNAKENGVDVHIFESNVYDQVTDQYHFIITNPPIRVGNEILYQILLGAKEHLVSGGQLIFVMNKDQGAKTAIKRLSEIYEVEVLDKKKGFYIICCTNN